MQNKTKMTFDVSWNGEPAAGIRPGSDTVRIAFEYGPVDNDTIEYFKTCIAEYFDGAKVYLVEAV